MLVYPVVGVKEILRTVFVRSSMRTVPVSVNGLFKGSEDSLVVTHPTTNSPACGLSTAERTGSPVVHTLWSYVSGYMLNRVIECNQLGC
ncbi:hypothetical protein N7527_007571 [Penicillium freii]|nr:hypothetical protein N7527_007571 [Penicillium freii]